MKKRFLGIAAGAALLVTIALAGSQDAAAATQNKETIGEGDYAVVRINAGDVTGDGAISTRDALRALQIAANVIDADEDMKQLADANGDGVINAEDAKAMLGAAMLGGCQYMGYEKPANDQILIVDTKVYPNNEYCFRSMLDAVEYVNAHAPASEEERVTILFAPGITRDHATVTVPYVTFRAMDLTKESKITGYYASGFGYYSKPTADMAATVIVEKSAHDFRAEHIVFENSYNLYLTEEELTDQIVTDANRDQITKHRQDVTKSHIMARAMYCRADRSYFEDCAFYGRQDTLYIDAAARMAFRECYVEGQVDFIYGSAIAVFEKCTINTPTGHGTLTAASTRGVDQYGFLFHNCKIIAQAADGKVYTQKNISLGRPWGGGLESNDIAMVAYVNCQMGEHVRTGNDRFSDMSIKKEEARWFEYGTMDLNGNKLDLNRVGASYSTFLKESDVTGDGAYAPWRWLYGTDGWNPLGYEK